VRSVKLQRSALFIAGRRLKINSVKLRRSVISNRCSAPMYAAPTELETRGRCAGYKPGAPLELIGCGLRAVSRHPGPAARFRKWKEYSRTQLPGTAFGIQPLAWKNQTRWGQEMGHGIPAGSGGLALLSSIPAGWYMSNRSGIGQECLPVTETFQSHGSSSPWDPAPEPAGWPPSRRSGALARRRGGKPARRKMRIGACAA
jgi:hypothetical protein